MARYLPPKNIAVYIGSEPVEIEQENGLTETITLEELYLRQEEGLFNNLL